MRSKDRINSQGIGRSMGYGFVEFSTHEAALAVIRAVSNNPSVFGPHKVRHLLTVFMYIPLCRYQLWNLPWKMLVLST